MSDVALLEEIRDTWRIDEQEWADIRKEGDKDIQCLTGGLWDAMDSAGAKQRKDAKRPMIALDELNQYTNQVINDLRGNKRGIKVTPMGNGATDKTALFRQGKIRDIEYRSNSHQAYTTLAENMIQRGYGFARIVAEYVSDQGFNQELLIEPIVDPNTCTPDAYSVRSDGKDLTRFWVRESRTLAEFKREFPGATIKNFGADQLRIAPQWFNGDRIDIAECWMKRYAKKRTLLALKPRTPQEPEQVVWKDTLQAVDSDRVLKSREVDQFTVKKYLTNGLEILETTDWPGQALPFICAYGKVVYVTDGGQTTRKMLSLVRLARDPQMLMAYLATCEAELVGMTPKFPYFFVDGQLSPASLELLAKSLHEPVAGIPYKATVGMNQNVLPPPSRQPYEPPIQALEFLKESIRRSIQAAIGASPLPTQAQRHNEKSGIALKQIEDNAQKGSFHFVDHYDEAIARTGTLLNELIPKFYDTARETSIRKPDDTVALVRINDPTQIDANGQSAPHVQRNQEAGFDPHIPVDQGDHDVTISVGPRQESEREAASDFADALLGSNVPQLVGPQKGPKLIAASIRLKNLGPLGDEMADIIDPKDQNDPAHAAQAAQQLQAENAHLKQQLQAAGQVIQTKQVEQQAKVQQTKIQESAGLQKAIMDNATKLAVARISAAKGTLDSVREGQEEALALHQQQVHEGTQNAMDRQHELNAAMLEHAQATAQAQQAHEHAVAQADQGHQQALEQGDQGVVGQLAVQAAAPQPEPAGAGA